MEGCIASRHAGRTESLPGGPPVEAGSGPASYWQVGPAVTSLEGGFAFCGRGASERVVAAAAAAVFCHFVEPDTKQEGQTAGAFLSSIASRSSGAVPYGSDMAAKQRASAISNQ
uniref:Uncharacterized protein n=1 Tax=Oryza sativa subsp. japonica TaxID=39947 RepID=Q7F8S1_ORYSJ|nr:hypothetical protein [Oryza sativa Japonica Group]